DGVLAVDPLGLEALLAFTGPVPVPGTEQVLNERNASSWLLTDQYEAFADDERRQQALADTAGAVFEAVLTADFPSIGAARDVLGSAVASDRLVGWTDGPEQFFAVSGLDGAFPTRESVEGDFLAVSHQNSAQNKIDVYLQRTVEYRASVAPDSGEVVATVTVTLENTAPTTGLAPSVIGSNDQGLPPGTNRQYLSVYSPHLITGARVDGEDRLMETNIELGWQTYATYLEIPAGQTVELELDLIGRLDGPYRLTVEPQSLAQPDRTVVDVRQLGQPLLQGDTTSDRPIVFGPKS
ncbi:MAG: DUF4012 domain-containing protein, partial [Acidimicrobiia bacterium]|nr:DUF4012 domain-containing protein [Acidimicrobiia bacterium]